MSDNSEKQILDARTLANKAESDLRALVYDLCPDDHKPTQRRDHLPPWCGWCGRTARGIMMGKPFARETL